LVLSKIGRIGHRARTASVGQSHVAVAACDLQARSRALYGLANTLVIAASTDNPRATAM
jgi:hypothetical protein